MLQDHWLSVRAQLLFLLSLYTAGDFSRFFIATEAVFYWLPALQAQT
jgi:hypothetical protein